MKFCNYLLCYFIIVIVKKNITYKINISKLFERKLTKIFFSLINYKS